jgi:hypothetical protein
MKKNEETDERTKIGELLICSACKSVEYCCKEHQVMHWPKHKKFCKEIRNLIVEYKAVRDNRPRHKMISKYMHECNWEKCRSYGDDGRYEENEDTDEMTKIGELIIYSACKSVQYCCKEHQVKDKPKHKKFCKRF